MKKSCFLLLAFCYQFICSAKDKCHMLDTLINIYAANYEYNGVILISHKGQKLVSKGYGYRDFEKKTKHDTNSVFRIGSITKQFTAEIILQLAAEKKLNLESNISIYFPQLESGKRITIHQLLSHQSGIPNYRGDSVFVFTHERQENFSSQDIIDYVKNQKLNFEPGSEFEYSNTNYALLGYIIEQITGTSFCNVCRERIFKPLEMQYSGCLSPEYNLMNGSTGYLSIEEGLYKKANKDDTANADGALSSNLADLLKWHYALLNNKILEKSWQQKAYTNYKHTGYGWQISNIEGKTVYSHSGRVGGFASLIVRCEEEDLCIIILMNTGMPLVNVFEMSLDIFSCLFNENFKFPELIKYVKIDSNTLQFYPGIYYDSSSNGFALTVSTNHGRFVAQGTGQDSFNILPLNDTLFLAKAANAKIEFTDFQNGVYQKLILHQFGGKKLFVRQNKNK